MPIESFPPVLPETIRSLYPFRPRTMRLSQTGQSALQTDLKPGQAGERMSYVDEGEASAPALVLLHGNLTWSFLFRDLISRARERFRVIAPDLVGFGLSSKPRDAAYHTLERHTNNLAQLISGLKLTKLTLVLHDWGGPIGLSYALRLPENVTRIVLMNSWAHLPADSHERLPFWLRVGQRRFGSALLSLWQRDWPDLRWAAAKPLEPAIRAAYSFPFRRAEDRVAPLAFAQMLQASNADPNGKALGHLAAGLKDIRCRVQILWGEQDPLHPSKLPAYLLRDSLPNCGNPVFLPQASHLVPEDAPEMLAEKVLETGQKARRGPLFRIL